MDDNDDALDDDNDGCETETRTCRQWQSDFSCVIEFQGIATVICQNSLQTASDAKKKELCEKKKTSFQLNLQKKFSFFRVVQLSKTFSNENLEQQENEGLISKDI